MGSNKSPAGRKGVPFHPPPKSLSNYRPAGRRSNKKRSEKMDKKMKEWIDNADYQQLLARWRGAPSGSPWFQGEVGDYYSKVMAEKKAKLPDNGVQASKNVGW
jgi:hypothetical protein